MSDHHGHGDGIHPAPKSFWTKYVFSIDHKVIALQFLFSALLFLVLGGSLALAVRYQLAWPGQALPYDKLLPGAKFPDVSPDAPKMVAEAPETHITLWKTGHELLVMQELTLPDGTKLPKGVKGTFEGFPQGIAVVLSPGTQVAVGDREPMVLDKNVNAWIEQKYVMADYVHEAPVLKVITVAGKPVTPRGADSDEVITLTGFRRTEVDPGSGADVPKMTHGEILVPFDAMATPIVLEVPEQEVKYTDAEGNEKVMAVKATTVTKIKDAAGLEAPLTASAATVQYTKRFLRNEGYLTLFTMHATLMVFFVLMPVLLGTFANFAIPLMVGARDMAFPKLNMLSFWLNVPASLIILLSFWTPSGAAGGGWTMYPTLSGPVYGAGLGPTLWCLAIFVVGFSTIVGTLNYITTIVNMRAPGMTMFRMPLTVWALFITAILALFATPVLAGAGAMLMFDRTIGTHFFQPENGGQPILWQHLFWFFGHPEVYILILPAMGIASDCLATYARKPIFGYKPMAYAMAAIAGLGFIVWGHHMFQSGMNPVLGTTFMATTIMIAVPSAIKTFNWLGTLWGGNIRFTTAMLFAIGFVSMFVIGGLSGIFMAAAPVDIHIHDTYFIVAHIHYVLFGGTIMAVFAGIYHWYPKMFGTTLNERWGRIHFILTMIGFNGTFFIMHVLGVGGHPRRYYEILKYPQLEHLQPINVVMTIFAIMMGAAQIPFIFNFFASMPRRLGRAVVTIMVTTLGLFYLLGWTYWSKGNFTAREFGSLSGVENLGHDIAQFLAFDHEAATQMNSHGVWSIVGFNFLSALIWGGVLTLVLGALWYLGGGVSWRTIRGYMQKAVLPSCVAGMMLFFTLGTVGAGHNLWLPGSTNVKPYVAQADIDAGRYETALKALTEAKVAAKNELTAAAEKAQGDHKKVQDTEIIAAAATALAGKFSTDPDTLRVANILAASQLRAEDWHEYRNLFAKLTVLAVAFSVGMWAFFRILWFVGGALQLKWLIAKLMYLVAPPIFMGAILLKKDPYIWLGVPEWYPSTGWGVAFIMGLCALPGLAYLLIARPEDEYGAKAGANPVEGNTLEWATSSPPPHYNFEVIPVVYRGPYEYASPVAEGDYLPQTHELPPGVVEPAAH